jgi:hypothetical protein
VASVAAVRRRQIRDGHEPRAPLWRLYEARRALADRAGRDFPRLIVVGHQDVFHDFKVAEEWKTSKLKECKHQAQVRVRILKVRKTNKETTRLVHTRLLSIFRQ